MKIVQLHEDNKIKETFTLDEIYSDDTIDVVKKKIISAMPSKIAYEELYLFAKKRKIMSKRQIYNELSQNTNVIPRTRLQNFLSNIVSHNIIAPAEEMTIDIDTIMSLNIKEEEMVLVPIGMDMNATYKFPFSVNPLLVKDFDDIVLSNSAHEMISTYNRNLLLNYGDLDENTLYIIAAEDAMTFLKDEHVFQIYYPFLFKKDITTREQLLSNREKLIDDNQREITAKYVKTQENIALLREIHKEQTKTTYIQKGISEITFMMRPVTNISIPIDVIFKLVKTSISLPFIKFNPGKKREKMYRLYANKSTINGKKIPYLTKSKLTKLTANVAREKSVGIYLDVDGVVIVAEFDIEANVKVTMTTDAAQTLESASKIAGEKLNPVLEQINTFIEQSGYSYKYFDKFDDNLVEIVNMKYIEYVKLEKPVALEKYLKCLKSVFSVNEGNLTKGIEMDYKRVDYYVEGTKIEKFIRRLMSENRNADEITTIVSENFDVSVEEARESLIKILNQTTTEQNVFANKRFKKQGNAGFTTTIKRDQFSGNVMIEVANINAVGYLDVIPIYLDAIIQLTQGHVSDDLARKCTGTVTDDEEDEPIAHDDIKSPPEQTLPERKDIEINPNNGLITQDSEKDEFIDDFFGESDLEDLSPEEEQKQGQQAQKQKTPTPPQKQKTPPLPPQKQKQQQQTAEIDGMPLNNPNFFFSRMQQRDSRLFLTKDDGKYKAYSRMCPHNMLRQPVVLTNEEKERIDREHSGSYTNAVKYGSTPDKQNWYICPRYWSIKDNVSLTEEEVKSGKYGGIIPPGSKKVPAGKYIYEFNVGTKNNEHIDEEGNYITHYPGFLKDDTHPEGMCVPCCFKQWDSKMQQTRREQCMKPDTTTKTAKQPAGRDDYIKEPNKYPLKQGAYGYLPMTIQKLLNSNNEKCQVSKKDKSLKPSSECILRKGVENSNVQSFISCLADAYAYSAALQKTPTIEEMKQIIIDKIPIETFVTLQNGNLVTIFEKESVTINYEKYKKSEFYTRLTKKSSAGSANKELYFKKVCVAYENFIDYIKDPTIVIDYTYLWDFVCKHLFTDKINLVVMNIVENDLTDNVEIICPTDVYSRSAAIYNARYKTLLIVKRESMYEPVYLIETDAAGMTSIREKFFNVYSADLGTSFKSALVDIRNDILKCAPFDSKPTVYKRNVSLNVIINKIKNMKEYSIKYQVINYNNKTIGIILSYKDEKTGYVPCEPSYIHPQYEIKAMDDDIYTGYEETHSFLKFIGKELKFPCKPIIKVIEDGAIVGIITETNQMVPLDAPHQNYHKDKLTEVMAYGTNIAKAETAISMSHPSDRDTDREKAIKRIRLETNFYNTFRNTVRIFLSKYENRVLKKKINAIIDDPNLYTNKLTMMTELLHELVDGHIEFVSHKTLNLDKIDKVLTCGKDCNKSYCMSKEDGGKCVLLMPKTHLISGHNNKTIYFHRIADEMLRYKHIREYLFTDGAFLIIEQIDYDLHKDEIVLLHDLLFKEYIESGDMPITNPYIKHNTHDDAQPSEQVVESEDKQNSDRTVAVAKPQGRPNTDTDVPMLCKIETSELGAHDKVYKIFHTKTTKRVMIKHEGHVNCGYELISKIIADFTKKQMEANEIKRLLVELYKKESDNNNEDLYIITMRKQGKKDIVKTMVSKNISLNTLIASDNYYVSNLDIYLIAKHLKLPLIVASGTRLRENNQLLMTINYDENNAFYYVVKQHGIVNNEVQRYSLIANEADGGIRIDFNEFTQTTKNAVKDNVVADGYIYL
jgi:hypothetical protein